MKSFSVKSNAKPFLFSNHDAMNYGEKLTEDERLNLSGGSGIDNEAGLVGGGDCGHNFSTCYVSTTSWRGGRREHCSTDDATCD